MLLEQVFIFASMFNSNGSVNAGERLVGFKRR